MAEPSAAERARPQVCPHRDARECVELSLFQPAVLKDSLQDMLCIPPDDVVVQPVNAERTDRTAEAEAVEFLGPNVETTTGASGSVQVELVHHTKRALTVFTAPWRHVEWKNVSAYRKVEVPPTPDDIEEFEIDLENSGISHAQDDSMTRKKSIAQRRLSGLWSGGSIGGGIDLPSKPVGEAPEQDGVLTNFGRTRYQLMHIRFPNYPVQPVLGERAADIAPLPVPPIQPSGMVRFTVRFQNLQFESGVTEPYFVSIQVLDYDRKRRLSEDFNFSLNCGHPYNLSIDGIQQDMRRPVAEFAVEEDRMDSLIIAVRIYKVLGDDPDKHESDFYNIKAHDPAARDKAAKALEVRVHYCKARLQDWRQPWLWGAMTPATKDGKGLLCGDHTLSFLGRPDRTMGIWDFLDKLMESKKKKGALRGVGGSCVISIRRIDSDGISKAPVMQPLPSKRLQEAPMTQYINTMFVYPHSIVFPSNKYRNVAIQLQVKTDDATVGNSSACLKCLAPMRGYVPRNECVEDKVWSSVTWHCHKPVFGDEFKVVLPPRITEKSHLLFSFYNIGCKPRPNKSTAKLIGYVFVPLFTESGVIENGQHQAMLIEPESVQGNYLSGKVPFDYVDQRKAIFSFRTKLLSSVFPQDGKLLDLFRQDCGVGVASRPEVSSLMGLAEASYKQQIIHSHVIMNYLVEVLTTQFPQATEEDVALNWSVYEAALAAVAFHGRAVKHGTKHLTPKGERPGALVHYVKYVFDNPRGASFPIHDTIVIMWHRLLEGKSTVLKREAVDEVLKMAWFLFDIIIKSMALHCADRNLLNKEGPRVNRFVDAYLQHLREVFSSLTRYAINLLQSRRDDGKKLVRCMAVFINDLFSLTDRCVVVNLIQDFAIATNGTQDRVLVQAKFDFFDILRDYEHYVVLNMPVPLATGARSSGNAVDFLRGVHSTDRGVVAKLMVTHVIACLAAKEADSRERAIDTLVSAFCKHEYDERYSGEEQRQRVAEMYFCYVPMLIDHAKFLEVLNPEEASAWLLCFLYVLKGTRKSLLRTWFKCVYITSNSAENSIPEPLQVFLRLLRHSVLAFKYKGRGHDFDRPESVQHGFRPAQLASKVKSMYVGDAPSVTFGESAGMDIPDLHVSKSTGNLKDPANPHVDSSRVNEFAALAEAKYARMSASLEEPNIPRVRQDSGTSLGAMSMSLKEDMLSATAPASGFVAASDAASAFSLASSVNAPDNRMSSRERLKRHKEDRAATRFRLDNPKNEAETRQLTKLQALTSTECAFIVLEALHEFIDELKDELLIASDSQHKANVQHIFVVVLPLMDRAVASRALEKLFCKVLPSFLDAFGARIFEPTHSEQLSMICKNVLVMMNFKSQLVREHASRFFFVMVKTNFERTQEINVLKGHFLSAMRELAFVDGKHNDFTLLSTQLMEVPEIAASKQNKVEIKAASLTRVLKKFVTPEDGQKEFLHLVDTLCKRMRKLLHDALVVVREQGGGNVTDGSMTMDVESTADLYLEIVEKHTDVMAVQAKSLDRLIDFHNDHGSYVEAAYCCLFSAAVRSFRLLRVNPVELPKSFMELIEMFPVVKEADIINDTTVTTALISAESIIGYLRKAISFLKLAEHFETAYDVYKVMIPVLEARLDVNELFRCYSDLCVSFGNITEHGEQRLLGSYYRVGFYGKLFESENGKEFVYKEPRITRLSELVARLKGFYQKKFGEGKFAILGDAEKASDPNKAYIQITMVNKYYDLKEEGMRKTFFEKNTRLCEFTCESPLTKSGKTYGALVEQMKRRTYFKTKGSFPCMAKRLQVIEKKEQILSPIENSIDNLAKQIRNIRVELTRKPTEEKSLQMVLQGSVLVQVNAGVIEICKTFLTKPGDFNKQHVEELRNTLQQFLKECEEMLALNDELIHADSNPHNNKDGEPVMILSDKEKEAKKKVQEDKERFHSSLCEGYEVLKEQILSYLNHSDNKRKSTAGPHDVAQSKQDADTKPPTTHVSSDGGNPQ